MVNCYSSINEFKEASCVLIHFFLEWCHTIKFKKLQAIVCDPFWVLKKVRSNGFHLNLPINILIHLVINIEDILSCKKVYKPPCIQFESSVEDIVYCY